MTSLHIQFSHDRGSLDVEMVDEYNLLISSPELGLELATSSNKEEALREFRSAATAVVEFAFSGQAMDPEDEVLRAFVLSHGGLGTLRRRTTPIYNYVRWAEAALKRRWASIRALRPPLQ